MTRILLLAGVFAFGIAALPVPAHAADSSSASSSLCKKHKKKHHGKKTKAAEPVKAPSSNI
jgi:hypothetical protein